MARWQAPVTTLLAAAALPVHAQTVAPPTPALPDVPLRPIISTNRWQEDWSVLADPRVPREPLDALKYIPLSPGTSAAFLSIGANQRLRYEVNDAPQFGVGRVGDGYILGRTEVHADLRTGPVQAFVQIQSGWTIGKRDIGPADRNRLDLEQGFVALVLPVGDQGLFKARIGRQQFAFDKQRFVSVRNGPNVRQSFDALWADYETGTWRFIAYATRPVVTRDTGAFDDRSDGRWTFSGLRIERKVLGDNELSAYWSRYTQDKAQDGLGLVHERRDVVDVRFAGNRGRWDWDGEAMVQTGRVGNDRVRAWYAGAVAGYTLSQLRLKPRLGLQVDLASGDRRIGDGRKETFNPLFPSGNYVTLAGDTGLANIVHVKPSVTLHPSRAVSLMLAAAAQWRMTLADAVYTQPFLPVAGTAGKGSRWTAAYGQARLDWKASSHLSFAIEATYYDVGAAIRQAGGRNSNYVGIEANWGF